MTKVHLANYSFGKRIIQRYTTEDDLILEKDITIDSDEIETEIKFNFKIPVTSDFESVIVPMLLYNNNILHTLDDRNSEILVRTGYIKDIRR